MGNSTSTTRKSTAGARLSSSGVRRALRKETDLDEEFSDLILHEVTKQQQTQTQSQNQIQSQVQQQHQQQESFLQPKQKSNPAEPALVWGSVPGTKQYNERTRLSNEEDAEAVENGKRRRMSSAPYKQFLNGLIEDEYNELNDGLLENDAPGLSRNILPDEEKKDQDNSNEGSDLGDIEMEDVDHKGRVSVLKPIHDDDSFSPTPDLSKVDFTKIVPQEARQSTTSDSSIPNTIADAEVASTVAATASAPSASHSGSKTLIPVEIKWVNTNRESIQKISIIGSFSNWRDVIRLKPSLEHQNEYITTINLPLGVHKLLYIINNEYRVSDQLPTATDQEGIFFNWFEVLDEAHLFNHSHNQPNHIGASTDYDANIITPSLTAGRYEVDRINKKSTSFLTQVTKTEQAEFEHVEYQVDDLPPVPQIPISGLNTPPAMDSTTSEDTPKYVSYQDQKSGSFFTEKAQAKLNYTSDIPEMFLNYDYFKNKGSDYQLPEPPQLPAHLNNVLLNKMSSTNSQNHHHGNSPYVKKGTSGVISPVSTTNHDPFKPPNPAFSHEAGGAGNKRPPLRRADSSYYASNQEAYHLSIPNHVILNHLMTTSIRNDVLTVACITRYSGKFVTQIMHSPADHQ